MPELPEVETSRAGIAPHLQGRCIQRLIVRQPKLRWPVPEQLGAWLEGQRILAVERRGKYILICVEPGRVLLHLGMSGSVRILPSGTPAGKHDHLDLQLDSGQMLRLTDPRRFGAVLWEVAGERHPVARDAGAGASVRGVQWGIPGGLLQGPAHGDQTPDHEQPCGGGRGEYLRQ